MARSGICVCRIERGFPMPVYPRLYLFLGRSTRRCGIKPAAKSVNHYIGGNWKVRATRSDFSDWPDSRRIRNWQGRYGGTSASGPLIWVFRSAGRRQSEAAIAGSCSRGCPEKTEAHVRLPCIVPSCALAIGRTHQSCCWHDETLLYRVHLTSQEILG